MMTTPWWQTTTIYQIYPRSFLDTNGDGIGDLKGITTKLDYVKELGFETVWISPFFCSPQQDFGYDICDYYAIDRDYGTMQDVELLINEIHDRGMRVLFDLVLNHTSIKHPWFEESRSSRKNPKRNWYIWHDGRGKKPPTNWKAIPGGPGWHFDAKTSQYYYASFLSFQPDLNWRNPEVKEAMFDVVRYWLDYGVDGFRLDIFHSIYKDRNFRDNPFSLRFIPKEDRAGFFQRWKYSLKQPEVYKLANELRGLVDSYPGDQVLIGEVFGNVEEEKKFLGKDQEGLNLIFLWQLLDVKPNAPCLRRVIDHYELNFPFPYLPVYVYGNHDKRRMLSQINGNIEGAKLLVLFQFTTRGVPVTYYGEEIGMLDGDFPLRKALDPVGNLYQAIPKFIFDWLNLYVNRDGCRTPMQWDNMPNAGFCSPQVKPWLPVNINSNRVNVNCQWEDERSILSTYRRVLKLRNEEDVLQKGELVLLKTSAIDKKLVVYKRIMEDEEILLVLNFSRKPAKFQNNTKCHEILLEIGGSSTDKFNRITLDPWSGVVLKK